MRNEYKGFVLSFTAIVRIDVKKQATEMGPKNSFCENLYSQLKNCF